jgi:hypothetical protein
MTKNQPHDIHSTLDRGSCLGSKKQPIVSLSSTEAEYKDL